MPSNTQLAALQEQLNVMRQHYAQGLPARLAAIVTSWQTIRNSENRVVLLADLHRAAHSLAGSGKTFGFTAISTEARLLEHFLHALIASGDNLSAEQEAQINVFIVRLCATSQEYDPDAPQLAFASEPTVPPVTG